MKYIARITDCGPLSFRIGRDTETTSTLPYVPGSTLLGGLAAAHTKLGRDADEFTAFFLSEGSSFGNLYPASFAQDDSASELEDLRDERAPVDPVPATARTCKRFGGFAFDQTDSDDPHHGVWDSLIAWAVFRLSNDVALGPLEALKDCPECGQPTERFSGFYRRNRDTQSIGKAEVRRGLRTRTGIDRRTGTVKHGILYSRQVLKEESQFWGTVTVPDDGARAFESFVEQANVTRLLRVGNNRTRGFGRIVLNLERDKGRESLDAARERIETFTAEVQRQAQEVGVEAPHAWYVPLTLRADAILLDAVLRFETTITPTYLAQNWGIPGADLIYQNTTARRIMGWNGLWRLPKADDTAIAKGSVFLFGFREALDDSLVQALVTLQDGGIGARRREGFGRLTVANPFHWEVKGS